MRIFSARRKAPPNLNLAKSSQRDSPLRRSLSSSRDTMSSEDDIRCPSALGSAVSISSLPPSPFTPQHVEEDSPFHNPPGGEYKRTRAISSPNLLRSLSLKVKGKGRARKGSVLAKSDAELAPVQPPPRPTPSPKPPISLPEEILVHVMSFLPRPAAASYAVISRPFAFAARTALYGNIDTSSLSVIQLEKLVALLASRSDLADFVSTFICNWWPPFFISETRPLNGYVIQHKDALITATFTLALERMSNLTSLTLPAFDLSLLAQHTAFGLKSLTFLHTTTTEVETKALFNWLDGQTNITSLRLPNLDDTPDDSPTPLSVRTNIPDNDHIRPGTAPASPYLKPFPTSASPFATPTPSPRSSRFAVPQSPMSTITPTSPFSSPTLLPHLATLHATPVIAMLLASPVETTQIRRPLKSVTLNVNTTLYTGLRPASLMLSLRGITRLVLRFSDNVDRRSFEKMLGAAGASLGSAGKGDPFLDKKASAGLCSLEVSFPGLAMEHSGRDEVCYIFVKRDSTFSDDSLFRFFTKAYRRRCRGTNRSRVFISRQKILTRFLDGENPPQLKRP